MKIFDLFGDVFINDRASETIDRIDKGFKATAATALKWATGIAAGSVAVGAALLAATQPAAKFQQELNNIGTLLDGDVDTKLSKFGEGIKELSISANTDTALLTDGLYQVISAVGETEDSMKLLETAAQASKAGNATVTDSVNLLSAVTKGYGDTSAEAFAKVSDLAFQTVRLGQTSFPELASSMGKVVPLAETLKISQEELFGATAALTGVTGNTAEVMTQVRGVMQAFLKPSKEMQASIEEMGYATGAAAVESLGMQGALELMKESVDGDTIAFANLFGSVEASTAALAITGSQSDAYTEKTKAMAEATGATQAAFERQNSGLTANIDTIKKFVNTLILDFGQKLLPMFEKATKVIIDNFDEIKRVVLNVGDVVISFGKLVIELVKIVDTFSPVILGVVAAFVAYKTAMLISQTIAAVQAGMVALNAVIAAQSGVMAALNAVMAANPFALVAIAIGLLVAAGVLLYKNWDTVVEKGLVFWEFLKSIGTALKESFDKVISFLTGFKSYIDSWFGQLRDDFVNYGKNIVLGLLDGINEAKEKVFNTIKNIANAVKQKFKDALKINSPSKVFQEFGENTIDGLTKGMNSREVEATESVGNIASSMIRSVVDKPIIRPMANSEQQQGSDNKNLNNNSNTSKETVINITQNMPKWASPQELARAFKKQTQAMALGV